MRLFPGFLLALVALVGVAAARPTAPPPPAPLDFAGFFVGEVRSEGVIDPLLGDSERLVVNSLGRRLPDRDVLLFQTITRDDQAPVTRYWRIRGGPDRWTFTGTDVVGAGQAERQGRTIVLTWVRRDGGMQVRQVLTPTGPGRLAGASTLRRLGVTFARITETYARLGPRGR